jgi:hypothetical protein
MRLALRGSRTLRTVLLGIFFVISSLDTRLTAQSTRTPQLIGVAMETSGGVIRGAKVTLTHQATDRALTFAMDSRGF